MQKSDFYGKVIPMPPTRAFFPALTVPETFKGKTQYKNGCILETNDPKHKAFMKQCNDFFDAKIKQWLADDSNEGGAAFKDHYSKRPIFKSHKDAEKKPIPGMALLNCHTKVEPKLLDVKGKTITGTRPQINGGSLLRIAVQPMFYAMAGDPEIDENGLEIPTRKVGVTFYIQAVKILSLNSFSSQGDDIDFGDDEGDYEYDESAFTEDESTDSVDDEDDF